jgi:hypothetical protein
MIDSKIFEKNFVANYENELKKLDIDIVRLYAGSDPGKYRAVEFLTQPLDEEGVRCGHLRSRVIAEKRNLLLPIENHGRGEGEVDLKRSFAIEISEYNIGDNEHILEVVRRLKSAEEEFYREKY